MKSILLIALTLKSMAFAQNESRSQISTEKAKNLKTQIEVISIHGDGDNLSSEPGSAHRVPRKELKKKKTTDVHQVLKSVPGVYVQEEDAQGLRPNIGFRGAHPHRSKKITLMEDGILIAPAPYSAPAAYYFPSMDNIEGLEVFKGPSSSRYGPNSIGGVLNLMSRDYQLKRKLRGKVSYGSFNDRKVDLMFADKANRWSWLLHSTYHDNEGFKQLPDKSNTGFDRLNTGGKLRRYLSKDGGSSLDFKFNYSLENSKETYLGLTSGDFTANGLQRYAASGKDEFSATHRQFQLGYNQEIGDESLFSLRTYRHQFNRRWSKFNDFNRNANFTVSDVLDDPDGRFDNYYRLLRGDKNTENQFEELIVGNNGRTYLSQGIQADSTLALSDWGPVKDNRLDIGARLHADSVRRNHTLSYFEMQDGQLRPTERQNEVDASGQSKDEALSKSLYLNQKSSLSRFDFFNGVRLDWIESRRTNFVDQGKARRADRLVTPGTGVLYRINDFHQVFAGVHRGMNLVGPGQSGDVKPEESINYELGYRKKGRFHYETVGFLSDYSNIVGVCSFSAGCSPADLNKKYNGGKAQIRGVEFLVGHTPRLRAFSFPTKFSMTYTNAEFQNNFTSGSSEWGRGDIKKGDPLPYIPEFQSTASLGMTYKRWLVETSVKYQGQSYDQALAEGRKTIRPFGTIDLLAEYNFREDTSLFVKADNILDRRYVVSYRPFGARPGKPLTVTTGIEWSAF